MNKKAKINFYAILAIVTTLALFSLYSIFATNIYMVEPTKTANWTNAVHLAQNITFNCTIQPGDWESEFLNNNITNMSVWYNASGGAATTELTTNTSTLVVPPTNETTWTANFTTSALADGMYNFTCLFIDNSSNLHWANWSANYSLIVIDRNAPTVSLTTFDSLNYSGSVLTTGHSAAKNISVTLTDGYGITSVFFQLLNGTGQQVNITTGNANMTAKSMGGGIWANYTGLNFSAGNANLNLSEGRYILVVWANDTFGHMNSTVNTTIIIDNTLPVAQADNFSTAGHLKVIKIGRNYSSNVNGLFNITIEAMDPFLGNGSTFSNDYGRNNVSGVGSVTFVIKNASGSTDASYSAAQIGSTGNWTYSSFNTSLFTDGAYNITATVTDSAGNVNGSAAIGQFFIDNTKPALTFSCDHATITQGETLTCSCSGTDATSGINTTSGFAYLSSPSTSNTGEYTIDCDAKDLAGNIQTATVSYNVEGRGSGSSSSSGGSSGGTTTYTTTATATTAELAKAAGVTQSLGVSESISVEVGTGTESVGVSAVTSTSATVKVVDTGVSKEVAIGETIKFDTNADGYYDTSATLVSVAGEKAELTFKSIYEAVPAEKLAEETGAATVSETSSKWWYIGAGIIVILAIAGYILFKKK